MIRLFLQLFTPVFIITILFIFNLNYVLEPLINAITSDNIGSEFETIALILDDSLKDTKSNRWEDQSRKLKQLQKQFLFDIDLLDLNTVNLPVKKKKNLAQGESIYDPDTELFYYASSATRRIWKFNLKQGKSEDDNSFVKRIATAPVKIITDKLQAKPEKEWEQALTAMSIEFKLPLSLLLLNTVDIEPVDLNNLKNQGIVVFNDDYLQRIYSRIPGTGYVLKLGPFEHPFIIRYINQIFIAMLGLLMATVVWLLLRPIWLDLSKLQIASKHFGEGELQTRIQFSKRSPIRNILKSFNNMASHIQKLIASHKELTRAVSHELRTPVARLRFSLEMLEETTDVTARKRFLREMNTDIEELDEMLAELLSYARMEADRQVTAYSPVVLDEWLRERTMAFQRGCHHKKIRVTHSKLPTEAVTCMDPKLMARALNNLFQNAYRYATSRIHIDFTLIDGKFHLMVDDDGPGIPEEKHDTIFEPFTRLCSSRDRNSGGYGLGLAIVRRIAEAHLGTIEIVKSNLGGTAFLLKFPVDIFKLESHANSRKITGE
jgi:signal transduction histidine kinase